MLSSRGGLAVAEVANVNDLLAGHAGIYIAANAALAVHIFHGAWSLWQSRGWSNPRFRWLPTWTARSLAAVIFVRNVSFAVAVQLGIASEQPVRAPAAPAARPAP